MEEITSNNRATRHPGRHQSERPADFDRKWWPTSIGMPGRHDRNPHYKGPLKLKDWAFAIAKRSTLRKARIALARRLAIIMHAMLRHGTEFKPA